MKSQPHKEWAKESSLRPVEEHGQKPRGQEGDSDGVRGATQNAESVLAQEGHCESPDQEHRSFPLVITEYK